MITDFGSPRNDDEDDANSFNLANTGILRLLAIERKGKSDKMEPSV